MSAKPTLLILCTGNACRSQMAEGFARKYWSDRLNIHSAGVDPHGMNPRAMKVMAEAGVPIDTHHSKHVSELTQQGITFDHLLTVCGHADEACPTLPGRAQRPPQRLHRGFEDPPKLAASAKSEEETLSHYRKVRDDIHQYIRDHLLTDLGLA